MILRKPWDPFPFSFLTLVVSLEAIFLSISLLIAANRAARVSERRSHLNLQIDLLAEQETTETMRLLHLIAARVGVEESAEDLALAQTTRPEKLLAQIDSLQQETASRGEHEPSAAGSGQSGHASESGETGDAGPGSEAR